MFNKIIIFLVIIAIGVLASPFLMNRHSNGITTKIIQEPPFPSQQAQNDTIQAIGDRVIISKAASIKTSNKTTAKHAKMKAWVVQIGPSKDKISALRLVNQLRAKGYNAFIHQRNAAFGEQVNVYLGPEMKRTVAEGLAVKASQETKLSTTIRSYKPLTA